MIKAVIPVFTDRVQTLVERKQENSSDRLASTEMKFCLRLALSEIGVGLKSHKEMRSGGKIVKDDDQSRDCSMPADKKQYDFDGIAPDWL